jgi:basic membrane protein A
MTVNTSKTIRWLSIMLATIFSLAGVIAILGVAQARGAAVQAEKIGLIANPGALDDNSFNEMSVAGLNRAVTELGVQGTVYTTTQPGDFFTQTQKCVSDGNALCFAIGYFAMEAISQSAHANPAVKFAVIDESYESYPNNLRGMWFASQEPSYLAGTLAGLMTQSDKLGVIGGWKIPVVDAFIDGYVQGAHCANPDVSTVVSYTNDFGNPALGAEFAQNMINGGADVIFPVAGTTGDGALITATQSGAWAIGVDVDQYLTVFMSGTITGSERMLTSAMKRIDNAVFMLISDTISGAFMSGTVTYDLKMGGVELAPYHEAAGSIPQGVKSLVERARQGILAGTIDVYGPCPTYLYLPYLRKEPPPPVGR